MLLITICHMRFARRQVRKNLRTVCHTGILKILPTALFEPQDVHGQDSQMYWQDLEIEHVNDI